MKIVKVLFSVEFLFALYLFAGYFKSVLTFIPIDLTFLLLMITFILAMKNLYNGKKVYSKPLLLWLVFIAFSTISLIYTHDTAISTGVAMEKYLRLLVITTWCFVGPFLIINDKEGIKRFIYGIISLGLIMGLFSLTSSQQDQQFLDVFGSNYQALGRISGSTALVFLGIYLFSNKAFMYRISSLFLSIILTIPMMMSGGRLTVIIFLIVTVVIFPVMFLEIDFKKSTIKIYKRFYSFIITLAALVSTLFILYKSGSIEIVVSRFMMLLEQEGGGNSVVGRTERMNVAVDMISSNPIFGHGIGSFGFYYLQGVLDDTPHHIFLEIWAELGLIALVIFLVIFIQGIYSSLKLWRISKSDWVFSALFILTTFWFVATLISSGLTSGKVVFAFLGLSIASYQVIKDKSNTKTGTSQ